MFDFFESKLLSLDLSCGMFILISGHILNLYYLIYDL